MHKLLLIALFFSNLFWMDNDLVGQVVGPNEHIVDSLKNERKDVSKQISALYKKKNELKHEIRSLTLKDYPYGKSIEKGSLYAYFSLPHVNSFLLKPKEEGIKSKLGFWGLSSGIDYFFASNQYIELSADVVCDYFVPVPAAVDLEGKYELMSSAYISLSRNRIVRRFSLGYGLVLAENVWNLSNNGKIDPGLPTRTSIKRQETALGIILTSKVRFKKNMFFGIKYRPTFFRFVADPTWTYEHVISLELGLRFSLK